MKKLPEKIELRDVNLRAEVSSSTLNAEERTVEAVFYTGAEVIRAPMFDEPFFLSFDMNPKSARLDRLNAGAPVIDSHQVEGGLRAVLGVVENARIENGVGKATLRFSRRPEVDGVWQDVQDRIVRNISMGVRTHAVEALGDDKATGFRRLRAIDWEPMEITVLGVPADAGAQIQLCEDGESSPVHVVMNRAEAAADAPLKEKEMETIKIRLLADGDLGKLGDIVEINEGDFDAKLHSRDLAPAKKAAKSVDTEAIARQVDEKLAADKAYAAQIKRVAGQCGLDDVWAQRQINLGASIDDVWADATRERAKRSPTVPSAIGFGTDYEAADFKLGAMADAAFARAKGTDAAEEAKPYRRMSLADMALECLSWQGKGRGLDPRKDAAQIFSQRLALHSTSDFPLLLENVLNKMLLPEYQAAEPTYRRIASQRTFNDFRAHKFDRSGDFPNLLQVNEHGEFTYGTMGENSESVTAATYGRIIGFSRQLLINDDLGAFSTTAQKVGRRFADFENATFYSTCILPSSGVGPALSDAAAVYHTNHGNTDTGVLSNTTLGTGWAKMMAQTSLDGLKLNVMPRYLLVAPTSYTLARTLVAAITPNQASQVNAFAGMIEPITDANLGTQARYYLLADPGALPNYVYGYVAGGGPRFEVRNGFEIDGVEFKAALDFACGAIEYRGGVSGTGS